MKHFNSKLKIEWEGRRINKESQLFLKNLLESIYYDQPKLTKALINNNTKNISTIIKVLSGHNCLNHHLYNAQLSSTAICNYCVPEKIQNKVEEPLETAHHLLCNCPAFNIERINIIYGSHTITDHRIQNTPKHSQRCGLLTNILIR